MEERWEGEAQVVLFGGLEMTAHVVKHLMVDNRWFMVATIDAIVAVSVGDAIQCRLSDGAEALRGMVTNVTTHAGVQSPRATSIRFESV